MNLHQYVPSKVCLSCDGCCRFQSEDSPWRPKTNEGYIQTIQDCGQHLCRFFNKNDTTCRIYHQRPFECALYPFLLSKRGQEIKVYVHLACPYIQDTQGQQGLEEYIHYLKGFFSSRETLDFLRSNPNLLHDYSPQEIELQYLFSIEAL